MPKAEVGSTKYIANKMKAKGLQRLRWYCQICEKQCRDENGFKQHTMSEGHVRAMMLVGEDPNKYINEYSNQFKRDFLQLLKTAHGEKKVHMNNFYQEYIRDKEHVHMNATKWPSLTEFAKFLGQQGICRVEEGDRGLQIQWIDDSPEAIRRREDVKKREKLIKGDEAWEAKMLERQIKAAREEAEKKARVHKEADVKGDSLDAQAEPVKVSLSLGGNAALPKRQEAEKALAADAPVEITTFSSSDRPTGSDRAEQKTETGETGGNDEDDEDADPDVGQQQTSTGTPEPVAPAKVSLSLAAGKPKASNPLMAKKKNPLSKKRDSQALEPEKKMSNVERIMREEMERNRGPKKPRFG